MEEKELCDQSMTGIKRTTTSASPELQNIINSSMIPAINRINQSASSSSFANSTNNNNNNSINSNNICLTPRSFRTRNYPFQSFPIVQTPTPPSRSRKIINPFEIGLAERYHLHFIDSPSLFQRAETPKHCSTPTHPEFEWTIDEVSSCNPANVEAHETQFFSQTDPDVEAKLQATISQFFRERLIVPSPSVSMVQRQISSQQPLLKCLYSHVDTPSSSQIKKRKCTNSTQTELVLPPKLPADLEEALKPYLNSTHNQQHSNFDDEADITMNSVCNDTTIDYDARRKLFHNTPGSSEISNIEYQREILQVDSPAPQTPEVIEQQHQHHQHQQQSQLQQISLSSQQPLLKCSFNNVETPSSSQIKKRKCTSSTQTELNLLPKLPAQLEEALNPYINYEHNQHNFNFDDEADVTMNSVCNDTTIDHDARDSLLRRKLLFHNTPGSSEISNIEYQREILQVDSPAPQTPDLIEQYGRMSGDIEPNTFFEDCCDSYDDNIDNFDNEDDESIEEDLDNCIDYEDDEADDSDDNVE